MILKAFNSYFYKEKFQVLSHSNLFFFLLPILFQGKWLGHAASGTKKQNPTVSFVKSIQLGPTDQAEFDALDETSLRGLHHLQLMGPLEFSEMGCPARVVF